ncbi:MAG TPA: adenylate/guanylate cyclase domain-containing protein [Microvirga sp.]|nr:adenylate/guanylate cyclase domain-containing protein [Microvirga sp.]
MEPPEVRYTKSGDVNIAYAVVGDGPFDVVFVSGWILSNLEVAWDGSAAEFYERMASFCRLILFDKRGTGLSDRTTGIPDLETRMDDIRAVMDAVGSKRAAIVGVSEGGPMTMLFTATYPERVAATVLYGTIASYKRADDYPWGLTPEEWDDDIRKSEQIVGTTEWLDERHQLFAPSTVGDPDATRWWRRWVRTSASPAAVIALRRMNAEIDVRHTLPAIRVPTLLLCREGDVHYVPDMRYIAERIADADYREVPGEDHGWWVNSGQVVDHIEPFLRGIWERGEWDVAVEPDRILATVLFTDIVGSTEMLAKVGDRGWREVLERHHAVVRRQLTRYAGREVDTAGDGFLASFDGPARAIRCARAIRDSLSNIGLRIRAGLHTGECEVIDGKVAGIAVHIGARVASHAEQDEILVSSTVKDLVAGSGIQFAEKGRAELKGIPGEWNLYAVTAV